MFSIIQITLFALFALFYGSTECSVKPKTREFMKPRYITSYDKWGQGEVKWDFPEIYCDDESREYFIETETETEGDTETETETENKKTIYEKYFTPFRIKYAQGGLFFSLKNAHKMGVFNEKRRKNRIYCKINKNYIKEAYSSFIKLSYKEFIKLENLAFEIQNLAVANVKGETIEADLSLLLLALGLSFMNDKNKMEKIAAMKSLQQSAEKVQILDKYKRINRRTNMFFIIFITILFRNIRNAE
jgi:hypothetical protein